MVISHGYWQRRFGGDPALVGARLTVTGRPVTVVGIAPPGFSGLNVGRRQPTSGRPWSRPPGRPPAFHQDDRWLLVLGRLAPGVAVAAAEAGCQPGAAAVPGRRPRAGGGPVRPPGHPHRARSRRPGGLAAARGFREPLLALLAGVGVLLLIVCLNVSHLLLARAIDRQREMNIRAALGASRARLVRQLLVESILLSGLGAAAGGS